MSVFRIPKYGEGVKSKPQPKPIFRHDVRNRIIFNCAPCAPGRLHPVEFLEERSTVRNRAFRRLNEIERVIIRFKHCRMTMMLEDSKLGLVQKNHILIGRRGETYNCMNPAYWIQNKKEYLIFMDWRFGEPMPVIQLEALKFVLNAFEAIVGVRPVFLEKTWRWGGRVADSSPDFTQEMLEEVFPNDWSKVKTSRVEK